MPDVPEPQVLEAGRIELVTSPRVLAAGGMRWTTGVVPEGAVASARLCMTFARHYSKRDAI